MTIYKVGSEAVIDESMVPFRGWVNFRQYITQRHHMGVKLFKLCTKDGYKLNLEVYCAQKILVLH